MVKKSRQKERFGADLHDGRTEVELDGTGFEALTKKTKWKLCRKVVGFCAKPVSFRAASSSWSDTDASAACTSDGSL